jgi:ABC-type dipeptide/oligopeptide/nickel transport system ATPase subunit
MGLIDPTAGIWFDDKLMGRGRDIRSRELRGRIQLVFQEPAESFDPCASARRWASRCAMAFAAERERRVREVAGRLGLAEPPRPVPGRAQRRAAAEGRHWPRRHHPP